MAQEENIISAKGIHKTYRTGTVEVQALRGIDFMVKRGEMVAVMGPSGCGKTTLLNCMSDNERTDYRARRMGFVFQLYNLLPVLSSVENVEMPLLVSGVSPAKSRKMASDALVMVGLPGVADRLPAELSGGQRQRVTIARALVNLPANSGAAEPTGDLDSETTGGIMDLLCKLNKGNQQTFVLVTHSDDVAKRADRIVRMRDGLIVDGK
jgi:ABC-type lipoprotein export system ATPase subunit